ncbi:serine/arginine repetitive matrix protein 1-like [Triticum dicoccoides]|uniref:serine/arginine repetitive matrix protein 1-like n=1 Tax=Triticum dicoccoides TaxID=85692 RepID=UPI00189148AE|nr:serine/arginine repetitive matrix protein 1-like [Triticum dicoccoides]
MVAMGADEEERPVHQGCMAGFLHLFDRPHVFSGKRRLCHHPRRLLSSSSSGSATPSEMSMPLERATPLPSSPEMTPPAAPRPSLQLPPLDLKDRGGAAASWRLPRLSLDSRAVVDARGKLRQRDNIRTAAPPSPGVAGSPSVVARLMGLDALPHGAADEEDGQHIARGGELRRSASERVPRDPARFRFVDPSFFEKPALLPQRPSSPTAEAALAQRQSPDPAFHRAAALQRRSSHFDAREVFPEPAKRVDPSAGRGEIALCGEIDRRLRKRGIAEPARDLETLKQILEALQLKGLLRHSTPPPPLSVRNHPPPIVVMRPSSRPPQPPTSPTRRLRVQVDNARRPRSPDRAASPARSPASPARRGPQSPQRRVSPEKRHQPLKKPNNADLPSIRPRIARHAAHNLSPDDDASTIFSDGGSSSSVSASASASSRWDLEQRQRARLVDDPRTDRGLLERCDKLLSSIEAFTGAGDAAADQQPSPVSVLDAATFLADEDSPSSSGSKRGMGRRAPGPRPVASLSFPEDDDEVVPEAWLVGPEASDPDFAYVAEVVCLSDRMRSPDDVYRTVEKRRRRGEDTWQHRRLLCGAAAEALDRWRCAHPSEPVAWLRGEELLRYVWAEVQRAMEPAGPAAGDDLNDQTSGAILRDLAADRRWSPSAEAADTVLQIERLLFKDLVADAICELAEADRLRLPRRKLVF